MDQLHLLFLLSFSMLIGAFFSGTVPMAFKLSETKSRLLALMGSGILVGTALSIIIPEGIDSIYGQPEISPALSKSNHHRTDSDSGHQLDENLVAEPVVQTWTIGVSLVAGFILMLFIDQFSLYQSGSGSSHHQHQQLGSRHQEQHEYSLANQEDDLDTVYSDDNNETEPGVRSETPEAGAISETKPIRDSTQHRVTIRENHGPSNGKNHSMIRNNSNNTKVTPTLGLVIHSAADGIALGAAATTSHRHVEMIIFLAIMLHKAPAAFSLVVFLIHRGLKHPTIRRHLLAFSLSAPIAALLTYFGLSQSGKEALRRNNATGIAMLFSAGTFLYVATVHVLPELVHNKLLTPKEMLFLVGGAFLPILLAQTI